jgi:hypothetical protein
MEQPTDKKVWTWQSTLQDHVRIAIELPFILTSPFLLGSKERECIHSGVNSKHRSALTLNLHSQLGRVSKVYSPHTYTLSSKDKSDYDEFINYGEIFAKNNGKGSELDDAYKAISTKYPFYSARCVESVASYMYWESLASNTISSFMFGTCTGSPKEGSNVLFEMLFFIWYAPFVLTLWLLTATISLLPSMPDFIVAILSLLIFSIATVAIVPVSMLGLVGICFIQKTHKPLPSTTEYETIDEAIPDMPDSIMTPNRFSVEFSKGYASERLGISLKQSDDDSLAVSAIDSNSMIATSTLLRSGDRIISINGENVESIDPRAAAKILREATGEVHIVASKADDIV